MQMLEAGGIPILADGVRAPDEDNPRGYYELEAVKALARDASFLAAAPGRAIKIVAPLLPLLPLEFGYRVVFVERDLDEVLDSQRAMMARRGTSDAADDPAMRAAFEVVLGRVWAWFESTDRVETVRVAHRALLDQPAVVAQRIAAFVGVGTEARVEEMAAVVAPGLHRQRGRESRS